MVGWVAFQSLVDVAPPHMATGAIGLAVWLVVDGSKGCVDGPRRFLKTSIPLSGSHAYAHT